MRRTPGREGVSGGMAALVIASALSVMILSFFLLQPILASVDTYSEIIQRLDQKKDTVVGLVVSSTTVSAVITAIPDDICTPIAEQLADLSFGFTVILLVLFAEKYLLTLFGGLTAGVLIPVLCVLFAAYYFRRSGRIRAAMIKLTVLAVAFLTIIPAGVFVSNAVERTFQESIDASVNAAMSGETIVNQTDSEGKNVWEKIAEAASNIVNGASKIVEMAKSVLANFVEAVAVLLITSCVIPLVVMIVYLSVLKYVFAPFLGTLGFPLEMTPRDGERDRKRRQRVA